MSWQLNNEASANSESVERTSRQQTNTEPYGRRKGNLKNKEKGQDGWSGGSDGGSVEVALKLAEGQIIVGHEWEFPFYSEYDENSLACLKRWNEMTLFVFFLRLFWLGVALKIVGIFNSHSNIS